MILNESMLPFGIELTESQAEKFIRYKDILLEWNEKINLTAITDEDEIYIKHFADSASLFSSGLIKPETSLVDIGTGAGFPGVPLKIIEPSLRLTLLDSQNKRINFLKELTSALNLGAVECVHARAEDAAREKDFRERFDIATARAVARLCILAEYCLPFVKAGGHFIAMKGADIDDELSEAKKAIELLGGSLACVKEITLPGGIVHKLVIIKKVAPTPAQYPRKAGKISKSPIK